MSDYQVVKIWCKFAYSSLGQLICCSVSACFTGVPSAEYVVVASFNLSQHGYQEKFLPLP
jgi:hypothetical protein